MHSVHRSHILGLMGGEMPVISTGYEQRYGDLSSSITEAKADYQVIAKISKFSFAPNHHYWLILKDIHANKLEVIERISYQYVTESYGYLYNNDYLDSLNVSDIVTEGTRMQKSLAFDEYENRTDGRNFNVCYYNLDSNMEDSIIFSDVAAGKLTSPLIKPVKIMINDNDIPLNIYGDDKQYKIFPDIGEPIVNANLIALRKEKKEESYYNQSVDRLRNITMSDECKQVHGKVIDVDIYCNNPELLENHYYAQLKLYYNELQRQSTEFVQTLLPYISQGYEFSYELTKLYDYAKDVCEKKQYIDKKNFSFITMTITVLEEKTMGPGDKAANRYGGKGIVSDVWPQIYMPRFKNSKGEYEYADIIFNTSTMYGRENVGQLFELSLTHIGTEIINKIVTDNLSLDEAYSLIYKYTSMCSPQQGEYLEYMKSESTRDELAFYIESIINSGSIFLSMRPISDTMTIDKLADIYKAFPFVKLTDVEVVMIGSNGQPRYIKSRKPILIGKQYVFRLKQYAEEKYSATSLSATNIRNENIKSRARKDYKELYPNTPIRFGKLLPA